MQVQQTLARVGKLPGMEAVMRPAIGCDLQYEYRNKVGRYLGRYSFGITWLRDPIPRRPVCWAAEDTGITAARHCISRYRQRNRAACSTDALLLLARDTPADVGMALHAVSVCAAVCWQGRASASAKSSRSGVAALCRQLQPPAKGGHADAAEVQHVR